MTFRNYCIIVVGDTNNVTEEIIKISNNEPNIIGKGGLFISTFTSMLEPNELKEYFILNKRSFFIFDLNSPTSVYRIDKPNIHEGLFGFLKTVDLDKMSKDLMDSITDSFDISDKDFIKDVNVKEITLDEIDSMSSNEKQLLMDELLDRFDKLSENDKKILEKIASTT
jgi:hypothetical protein